MMTTERPVIQRRLITQSRQGRCDHGEVLTATCDECRTATAPTQPAPDPGEWRIFEHYYNTAGERTRILDSSGVVVAETQTGAQAVEIIAQHNALPKLVAALEDALTEICAISGRCDHDTEYAEICVQCQVRTALNTVRAGGE